MLTVENAISFARSWSKRQGQRPTISDARFIQVAFPNDAVLNMALTGDSLWKCNYKVLGDRLGMTREAARSRFVAIVRRLRHPH